MAAHSCSRDAAEGLAGAGAARQRASIASSRPLRPWLGGTTQSSARPVCASALTGAAPAGAPCTYSMRRPSAQVKARRGTRFQTGRRNPRRPPAAPWAQECPRRTRSSRCSSAAESHTSRAAEASARSAPNAQSFHRPSSVPRRTELARNWPCGSGGERPCKCASPRHTSAMARAHTASRSGPVAAVEGSEHAASCAHLPRWLGSRCSCSV